MYMSVTILFSMLLNSFFSTHEFYFVFFPFSFLSPDHWKVGGGVSEWLYGAGWPAGLSLANILSDVHFFPNGSKLCYLLNM